ncbi:zinc ribbon domain-containing protein [Tenacibaculum dicentrarchi]|nr:zinc ribbon domain-containing protein [Tenacibaculum dicentrarchi]
MYCIECGAQIPENSKFCSHCGQKQTEGEPSAKEKIAEKIIETEIVRQVVDEHKKNLDYEFLRKAMGWYLAWVVIHLGILLIASDGIFDGDNMGSSLFWPVGKWGDLEDYDITEFLVYTIFPLAILFILSMVRSQNNENELTNEE